MIWFCNTDKATVARGLFICHSLSPRYNKGGCKLERWLFGRFVEGEYATTKDQVVEYGGYPGIPCIAVIA
jgi:hypothetical protein